MTLVDGIPHSLDGVRLAEVPKPEFCDPNKPAKVNLQLAHWFRQFGVDQMVVFADDFSEMTDAAFVAAEFTKIERFREGREKSRQGVYFGELAIETDLYPTAQTFVAVKPYDNRKKINFGMRRERALVQEWATNLYLNSISNGSAYEPIGFWRNADTYYVPQLLTRFNESSVSLDNVFGETTENGGFIAGARAMHAMNLGFLALGIAHGVRLVHGDAFPQNFAIQGRRIIFNDTTSMRPYPQNETKRIKGIELDVEAFTAGTMVLDSASDEMSVLSLKALLHPDFRSRLYASYLKGAQIGASRAGYSKDHLLVPEDVHHRIIRDVVDRYDNLRQPRMAHY